MNFYFTEVRNEAENRLKNAWQNYCETGDDLDANSSISKRAARLSSIEDETMLPLPDEVLTKNLGLDIVVVVTKVRLRIFGIVIFIIKGCSVNYQFSLSQLD